jgi:hypothetical protein
MGLSMPYERYRFTDAQMRCLSDACHDVKHVYAGDRHIVRSPPDPLHWERHPDTTVNSLLRRGYLEARAGEQAMLRYVATPQGRAAIIAATSPRR